MLNSTISYDFNISSVFELFFMLSFIKWPGDRVLSSENYTVFIVNSFFERSSKIRLFFVWCDPFKIETEHGVQQEIKLFAPHSLGKENKLNPAGEALMNVHHSDKHWWHSLADSIDDCPSNCFGNGDCVAGNCHCFPGFRGPDCSRGEISVDLLLH